MMSTEFLFLGGVAALWGHIQGVFQRLRALLMVRAELHGEVALAVRTYAQTHWRRLPAVDRFIKSSTSYVRPLGRIAEVAWDAAGKQPSIYLVRGWLPVWVGGVQHKDSSMPTYDHISLMTVRLLGLNVDELISRALAEHNARSSGVAAGDESGESRYFVRRVVGRDRNLGNQEGGSGLTAPASSGRSWHDELRFVRDFIGWGPEDVGQPRKQGSLEAMVLPPEMAAAADEFGHWMRSRAWYEARGIPWRRGWLLYGQPGTGKTSFVRGLALRHDLPVWVFDLSTLTNAEMTNAWQDMQASAPCIALIEDIDGVFNGRDNVLRDGSGAGALTFDCLLNCMSGIQTADGVFTVVTTNRMECVDPALGVAQADGASTRPGRLDRVIEVPPLSFDLAAALVHRILADWPAEAEEVIDAMRGAGVSTAAQVTELCVERALDLFWTNKKPEPSLARVGEDVA